MATSRPHRSADQTPDPLVARFTRAFKSARLTYRSIEPDDVELITRIKTDPVAILNDNISWARPHNRKDTQDLMARMEHNLISVIAEADGIPVGLFCLWPCFGIDSASRMAEFAVDILPAYRGKGYAREGLRWLLDWAFDMLGQQRVRIQVFGWNTAAIRLYEKLGSEYVGTERECIWRAGKWWDLHMYGILAKDWYEIRAREEAAAGSGTGQ